jgi:GxxExxY protein
MNLTQSYINNISYSVVGAAIEVHKQLGPGLLESVYHSCFLSELNERGIKYKSQVKVPILYKGNNLDNHLILDVLIEDLIIVELKATEELNTLYEAQLLSYMKLANKPKGLLINFNCETIIKSLKPLVNDLFKALPKE